MMSLPKLSRLALLAALPAATLTAKPSKDNTGPSSSDSSYLVPSQPGVYTTSILTTGDAVNYKERDGAPYRMVGTPDGLGAFDNEDGTFTLLMNHELGGTSGVVRDHGFAGAFISKWIIDKQSLEVLHGEDLIKWAFEWSPTGYAPAKRSFTRFCSGDLAPGSAFYNAKTGLGYNDHIYMAGEENGTEGRLFAHFLGGASYELPWLGKFSCENVVANPGTGDKTVVAGFDDNASGQVYIYVGEKKAYNPLTPHDRVAAAGLTGGKLFGIKIPSVPKETDATTVPAGGVPFTAVDLGDVSTKAGTDLETASNTALVTAFNRPEDGSWNPSNPKELYFASTASFTGVSRLWRLRFNDPANPAAGGVAEVLVNTKDLGDGTRGPLMMDNITVTKRGSVIIQEDIGGQAPLGKVWRYNIARGTLEEIAKHDPQRFLTGAPGFLTQDEESSGVIPMDDILGAGWFLLDIQAHYNRGDAELVEGGQLVGLYLNEARGGSGKNEGRE